MHKTELCSPPQPDNTEPYLPQSLHAGWLGNSFKGMWLPKGLQGSPVHTQQYKNPSAAEWGSLVEMKQLTGRAILFGVCIQSCQFRFPFHLLNQELCRTKCQAGFKARGCVEPQAAITLPAPSCLLSGSSHCRHWSPFSPNPLIPLKIFDGLPSAHWPLKRQAVQRCSSSSLKSKLSCLARLQKPFCWWHGFC